jgi:hypothetical protein
MSSSVSPTRLANERAFNNAKYLRCPYTCMSWCGHYWRVTSRVPPTSSFQWKPIANRIRRTPNRPSHAVSLSPASSFRRIWRGRHHRQLSRTWRRSAAGRSGSVDRCPVADEKLPHSVAQGRTAANIIVRNGYAITCGLRQLGLMEEPKRPASKDAAIASSHISSLTVTAVSHWNDCLLSLLLMMTVMLKSSLQWASGNGVHRSARTYSLSDKSYLLSRRMLQSYACFSHWR